MIKYTRTRSGRSYDLTAPMSVPGRQQRRRAGMSEHQLHVERRENTTDRPRVARARQTTKSAHQAILGTEPQLLKITKGVHAGWEQKVLLTP